MAKYIIFTNNNDGTFPELNPFQIMGISGFGGNFGIAAAGQKGASLITEPNFIFDNHDFLFLSDISVEADYIALIHSFVDVDEAFVLLHSGNNKIADITRKEEQKQAMKQALGENFEWFIEQSHGSNSIYWSELIELAQIISSQPADGDKYNNLLEKLAFYWPHPHLESLIHLHKTLSIAQLKIKKPNLSTLEGKDEYTLAIELWNNRDRDEYSDDSNILKWTCTEIRKRSAQS